MTRKKMFSWLAKTVTARNKSVLVFCAVITVAMVIASGRMGMRTQISDMLPADIPLIEEFNKIIDDFSSASTIIITVENENKNVDLMKKSVEDIAGRLKNIVKIAPKEGQSLGIIKKAKMLMGEFPLKGVVYDTTRLVRRIDYKIDKEFVSHHGMMMQKPKDLGNFIDMFGSLDLPGVFKNINDNFEKEYVNDAENLTSLDGEQKAISGLDGMQKFIESIGKYLDNGDTNKVRKAVEAFISGPEYFISSDNTMMLVMLQPAVSWESMETTLNLAYQVRDSLQVIRKDYPALDINYSGGVMLQVDETEAVKKDFGWPSVIALALILILLIGSFRTWKNPFFSVFVLIVGIIWVAGILALVLHYLNMMSASFGIILIGLGIDFGIHFISGFRDGREKGLGVSESIEFMYQKIGSGVITGGMTTAVVFYALALARFKSFTEMGIAIGTGIVVVMIAFFVLLPALIVWDNKGYSVVGNLFRKIHLGFIPIIFNVIGKGIVFVFDNPVFNWVSSLLQFRFLEKAGRFIVKTPVAITVIVISIVLTYFSIQKAKNIEFEYDMMKLEPEGITTVVTQDKIIDKFEIAPDYALLTSDNLKDCREKIKQLKKIGNKTGLIGRVDGITEFLPEVELQEKNIPVIKSFKRKIKSLPVPKYFSDKSLKKLNYELSRLHQNIVEIGELSVMGKGEDNRITKKCDEITGKKDEDSNILSLVKRLATQKKINELKTFQKITGSVLKEHLLKMTSTDIITVKNLPRTISERYINPNNDRTLITIYPKSQVWEQKHLRKFHNVTSKISEKITGLPAMTLIMLDMMAQKGKVAVIIGAFAIMIFLLIDFRSFKYTLLAGVPLFVGASWMLGLMSIFGIKYNMANFMALPLIIGIGIDDGVHILHRYKIEGRGKIPEVMKYTGRAILLTSLTTMIGFGSMGLASHRGMASMGQVLFMGVGACFISSAFLLPAIMTLVEKVFDKKEK